MGALTAPGHYPLQISVSNVYGQTRVSPDPVISKDAAPSTSQTVATNGATINSVAYGGTTFVAVGDGGLIRSSVNLANWTTRTSNITANLRSVAYIGGQFLAGSSSGHILSSPTGATWTSRNSGTSACILGFAYGNGMFVACLSGCFPNVNLGLFSRCALQTFITDIAAGLHATVSR